MVKADDYLWYGSKVLVRFDSVSSSDRCGVILLLDYRVRVYKNPSGNFLGNFSDEYDRIDLIGTTIAVVIENCVKGVMVLTPSGIGYLDENNYGFVEVI